MLESANLDEISLKNQASPTVPSWNQLRDCLRQLDILRKTLAA
jgi:hypothetical protein